MNQPILTREGKETGRKINLSTEIFGIEPNQHVIYLDVKRITAAQRQGTHKVKERGEVAGSRRKLIKQKGTGNARKGDKKASILRGGGRNHGPRPRSYTIKLNKKTMRLARKSALSLKAQNKHLTILEDFTLEKPQTKVYHEILGNLSLQQQKTLLILPQSERNIALAARNIPHTQVVTAPHVNTYDILHAQRLLLTEAAVKIIQEQFA